MDRPTAPFRLPLAAAVFLAPLAAAQLAHGTAIAAIRTPSELVIAADSRVVDGRGRRLPDTCKVRVVNDTVFALHGMSLHPAGLDLFALVTEAVASAPDLRSASREIASRAAGPIGAALEALRSDDPTAFERYAGGRAPAGILLARVERGRPAFAYLRFVVEDGDGSPGIHVEVRACPGRDCPTGRTAVLVGPAEHVRAFRRRHPDGWTRDAAATAFRFVREEVSHRHGDIGGPVQALRLTGEGIDWISRRPPCPAPGGPP